LVQSLALAADSEDGDFRSAVAESPQVRAQLEPAELAACFELGPYLAEVDESFRRLGLLEPASPRPSGSQVER
jgi:hypothetical protein